jgi:hypothetical protein
VIDLITYADSASQLLHWGWFMCLISITARKIILIIFL